MQNLIYIPRFGVAKTSTQTGEKVCSATITITLARKICPYCCCTFTSESSLRCEQNKEYEKGLFADQVEEQVDLHYLKNTDFTDQDVSFKTFVVREG